MAGFEALGDVLAGGIDREGAFQQGRYRSAQTEQAISTARKNQAEALKAERINSIADAWRANAPDLMNPNNQTLADVVLGGMGSDFSAAQTGRGNAQETNLRGRIADPGTDAATEQRLRSAVGDSPFNPIDAVGTRGAFSDARAPDLGVQKPLGEDMFPTDPTNAIQNYEYALKLPPAQRGEFSPYVRNDQIVRTDAPSVARPVTGGPDKPVVPIDKAASDAAALAAAKTTAVTQSKLMNALPGVKESLTEMRDSIKGLLKEPGFATIYGASGQFDPHQLIAGTDYSNAKIARDKIDAQSFGIAVQKMRGLGQLSNAEGLKVQQAFTTAIQPGLSDEAAELAWNELLVRLDRLERVAETEAGVAPSGNTPAGAAPAGGVVKWTRDANGRPVRAQ